MMARRSSLSSDGGHKNRFAGLEQLAREACRVVSNRTSAWRPLDASSSKGSPSSGAELRCAAASRSASALMRGLYKEAARGSARSWGALAPDHRTRRSLMVVRRSDKAVAIL